MKKLIIIAAVLTMIFPRVNAQNNVVSGSIGSSVDNYLSRTVPFGFSGAVMVAENDKVLLNKGYGYAVRENKIENSTSSVFSTGSVTKQFTAAAIMKLEMMGKLNTDDKLSKYFQNLPIGKEAILLRHPVYPWLLVMMILVRSAERNIWKNRLMPTWNLNREPISTIPMWATCYLL